MSSRITLIGDIACNGLIAADSINSASRLKNIYPIINAEKTIVIANLETPLCVGKEFNTNKKIIHVTNTGALTQYLSILNIKVLSLANNHIYDCTMAGLKETIAFLDKQQVLHTGAGWLKDHIEPVTFQSDGVNVGFIAYVDKSTNPKTEHFPELLINYFDAEKVIQEVRGLKPRVDKIICSIHWGEDYSYYPTKQQVTIARMLVDEGVDIVMGHHPHTIQPYERYKNGIIFYSLGGLTFGDFWRNGKLYALYRKTKIGLIASCSLKTMQLKFNTTKELQGNYVQPNSLDYNRWSLRKWRIYRLKEKSRIVSFMVKFNERFIYRVFEYFFGYYQSPFKRLIQLSNLKKVKKLFVKA